MRDGKVLAALVCLAALCAAGVAATQAQPAPAGERWALLIGIDDYQATAKLQFCREDAAGLGKALVENGGFNSSRVKTLTDGGKDMKLVATRGNVSNWIEQFAKLSGPDDTVVIFFSGHAMQSEGQTYLMAVDSNLDPGNSVSLEWIKNELSACKAKEKVLILDVCHAEGAKGVSGIAPSLMSGVSGVTVLSSCDANQISYMDEKSGHGVFTGRLIEALSGAADANGDKKVTIPEAFAYVKRSMTEWCLDTGRLQTPVVAPETPPEVVLTRVVVAATTVSAPPTSAPVVATRPDANGAPTRERQIVEGIGALLKSKEQRNQVKADSSLRVPEGFHAKEGTTAEPYTTTGWAKEVVHDKTGIEMVFIPAGEFQMGSPDSEAGREKDERPVHTVRITRPFYLGKYEVTQGEWKSVMGSSPSKFTGDRNPVEMVSWNFCQQFLGSAGDGLTLPTEAQWEYACRAGIATRYSLGYSGELGDSAWYDGNSDSTTHPVGQKRPNLWGLYDIHGNVWEWCADWSGPYAAGGADNPQGPSSGASRVLRGGSWFDDPASCRSAYREMAGPATAGDTYGLRVARGL